MSEVNISTLTLSQSLEDIRKALFLCLNNDFEGAKNVCNPLQDVSMYHAFGASVLELIEALFTFERDKLLEATARLEKTIEIVEKHRKQNSFKEAFSHFFTKTSYEHHTEIEIHAELCYSECLMFVSAMTLIEDEALGALFKAAMKMRNSYQTYKKCQEMLAISSWNTWTSKNDFQTGVQLGIGTFSVMISILPPKLIKFLEVIGFSGDREYGLKTLKEGCGTPGLRQPLCTIIFMIFELVFVFMLSFFLGNLTECESLLNDVLVQHPNGCVFLFLKARLEMCKGNIEDAINWYQKMIYSQKTYKQINTFAHWDLVFLYSLKSDWKNTIEQAENLTEVSNWSRSIYAYQKAASLIMIKGDSNEIAELMKMVPKIKLNIRKSAPSERFVNRKSERYFAQSNKLYIPMYEFLYVWNYFKLLSKGYSKIVLEEIEEKLRELDVPEPLTPFDYDNKGLLYLIKGVCLRQLGEYDDAVSALGMVLEFEKKIVSDMYIAPYARAEIGLVCYERGLKSEALKWFDEAKKNYSGYPMENRLHFRIKSVLVRMQ